MDATSHLLLSFPTIPLSLSLYVLRCALPAVGLVLPLKSLIKPSSFRSNGCRVKLWTPPGNLKLQEFKTTSNAFKTSSNAFKMPFKTLKSSRQELGSATILTPNTHAKTFESHIGRPIASPHLKLTPVDLYPDSDAALDMIGGKGAFEGKLTPVDLYPDSDAALDMIGGKGAFEGKAKRLADQHRAEAQRANDSIPRPSPRPRLPLFGSVVLKNALLLRNFGERNGVFGLSENDLVLFNNGGVMQSVVGALGPEQIRVFHECNLAGSDDPAGPSAEDVRKWA
ncbi:hypothetical protein B0H16DRAFT_1704090 [Mycena metata]|uniref:Uncharacterized protein n=1 Tax=Mycena metata TaxID=1033252 RepID=A0AAD7GYM7_9AGAR|nr:hypothetical protein B0H16DRAFT_1704090 [Mycena metata]